MAEVEAPRHRTRIFNTPFETGLRSVIILTACYPAMLGLNRLVVFDHLVVHTDDFGGPPRIHPKDRSRAAEVLVRRRLIEFRTRAYADARPRCAHGYAERLPL